MIWRPAADILSYSLPAPYGRKDHYLGLIRISPHARTLEATMEIEPLLERVSVAVSELLPVTLDVMRNAR